MAGPPLCPSPPSTHTHMLPKPRKGFSPFAQPWGAQQPVLSLAWLLPLCDHQSFASDLPVSLLWGHQEDTGKDLPTCCRRQCNGQN